MLCKLTVLVAASAMFMTAATASEWELISSQDGSASYVDIDTILRDGSVVNIWLKVEYNPARPKGEVRSLQKWQHDCANRRAKLLAVTRYKANGAVIGSAELPHYWSNWDALAEGTVGAKIHARVCEASEIASASFSDNRVVLSEMSTVTNNSNVIVLKSGAIKVPAKTASGYCLEAPAGYRGTGSIDYPAITTGLPRCGTERKRDSAFRPAPKDY